MKITMQEIRDALSSSGYCSNSRIDMALWASAVTEKPLIIEGDPGVGKTSAAKALAKGLGMPFIRVQMYDGLTDDKILYDYDYQKQLLTLESIKTKLDEEYSGMSLQQAIEAASNSLDFYGEQFLIKRPVLRSITSGKRCVILFDEMDKAPEEIEYMLYEFLEDYSITVPQYGEIRCPDDMRPLVFVTSNGYRDLSDAFRRRCSYLYIDHKTRSEIYDILKAKTACDDSVANGLASCMAAFADYDLHQQPSISEAIDMSNLISEAKSSEIKIDRKFIIDAIGMLAKSSKDIDQITRIVDSTGKSLWEG